MAGPLPTYGQLSSAPPYNSVHQQFPLPMNFVTMRTAPLPDLPKFSGHMAKDGRRVEDIADSFTALAGTYAANAAPNQLLLYRESHLSNYALNWYKFYVTTNPSHRIDKILTALVQQFSSCLSPTPEVQDNGNARENARRATAALLCPQTATYRRVEQVPTRARRL